MPISLTFSEGVLSPVAISQAAARITNSLLKHHALTGNQVMTRNVTALVNVVPKGLSFAGGEPVEGAWIETKTPSFALASHEVQSAFFTEATQIIHELSGGKLPKESIWSNGVHAVDGTWNLDGVAMTNAQLGEALSKG